MLAERGGEYGPFADQACLVQELKETVLKFEKLKFLRENSRMRGMTHPEWEALEMILHKIGRIVNGNPHNADSWQDIAGYATLVVKELSRG